MEKQILVHPFQTAGLGSAPFGFSHSVDRGRVSSVCDFCGAGLRYEFWIHDAEGHESKVGSDCINKVGDSRLSTAAHEEQLKIERAHRIEKREAAREARLQAQRDHNGGLTDYEQAEAEAEAKKAAERARKEPAVELLSPLAEDLELSGSNFSWEVAATLRDGGLPRGRGLAIAAEIIAKRAGRKNSKAYAARYAEVSEIFQQASSLQ